MRNEIVSKLVWKNMVETERLSFRMQMRQKSPMICSLFVSQDESALVPTVGKTDKEDMAVAAQRALQPQRQNDAIQEFVDNGIPSSIEEIQPPTSPSTTLAKMDAILLRRPKPPPQDIPPPKPMIPPKPTLKPVPQTKLIPKSPFSSSNHTISTCPTTTTSSTASHRKTPPTLPLDRHLSHNHNGPAI